MKMAMLFFFLLIASSLTSSQGAELRRHCRVNCLSWRVANEANNTVGWNSDVPKQCKEYIKQYLLGYQYGDDSQVVIEEAIDYIQNLPLPKDGRNIWIFDIDDTIFSNAQYFVDDILGSESWNAILPNDWMLTAKEKPTVLPQSKRLYKELVSLGIKVVFLTGRNESQRESTEADLISAGFDTWERLILRTKEFEHMNNKGFKSRIRGRLQKEGYRIVGNIGDQWSDIAGPHPGRRAFKLPNPMYYTP